MEVRLNSTLRGQIGRRSFLIDLPEGTRVDEVLVAVADEAPALHSILWDQDGHLHSNFVIFRNGRKIEFFDGLNTSLLSTDILDVYPKTGAQRAFADSPSPILD